MNGGRTERAVLCLVGGSHHWQAGADPAAAGETCRRVSLRHGVQGLQGGQREVVDLVSDTGLGAGAVFRASALEGEAHTLLLRCHIKAFPSNLVGGEEKKLHIILSFACCCYRFRTAFYGSLHPCI